MSDVDDANDAQLQTMEIIGLVLYAVPLIVAWVRVNVTLKDEYETVKGVSVRKIFHFAICGTFTTRVLWLIFLLSDLPSGVTFLLNRMAFLFDFTAFTSVVYFWAETFHTIFVSERILANIRPAFLISNIVVYLVELMMAMVLLSKDPADREKSAAYKINVAIIAGSSLLAALAFWGYGLAMTWKVVVDGNESLFPENPRRALFTINGVTTVFAVCFSARFAMFLIRPLGGENISVGLFFTFAYFVPDIIPGLIQLYLMRSSFEAQRATTLIGLSNPLGSPLLGEGRKPTFDSTLSPRVMP